MPVSGSCVVIIFLSLTLTCSWIRLDVYEIWGGAVSYQTRFWISFCQHIVHLTRTQCLVLNLRLGLRAPISVAMSVRPSVHTLKHALHKGTQSENSIHTPTLERLHCARHSPSSAHTPPVPGRPHRSLTHREGRCWGDLERAVGLRVAEWCALAARIARSRTPSGALFLRTPHRRSTRLPLNS